MFTGLVQARGAIVEVVPAQGGLRIVVDARALAPRPIAIGDSIAVSGVCLTVTTLADGCFGADVSRQTLECTQGLDHCHAVNLETSLALGDKLGGHLVAGHVDGVATVQRLTPVGPSYELELDAPAPLAPLLAVKGSVAIDGVSLTINAVTDLPGGVAGGAAGAASPAFAAARAGGRVCRVSINLIPHTVAVTTLNELKAGTRVNLEVDLIARYVARMLDPALGRENP